MPSSFTLGAHFENFIRHQVSIGRYASGSEVVRDSLRLLEEREDERSLRLDALREAVDRGTKSGEGAPAAHVFDTVRDHIRKAGGARTE